MTFRLKKLIIFTKGEEFNCEIFSFHSPFLQYLLPLPKGYNPCPDENCYTDYLKFIHVHTDKINIQIVFYDKLIFHKGFKSLKTRHKRQHPGVKQIYRKEADLCSYGWSGPVLRTK